MALSRHALVESNAQIVYKCNHDVPCMTILSWNFFQLLKPLPPLIVLVQAIQVLHDRTSIFSIYTSQKLQGSTRLYLGTRFVGIGGKQPRLICSITSVLPLKPAKFCLDSSH